MAIYLNLNDNVLGPYTENELHDMLAHREVRGDALARKEGEVDWTTLDRCLNKTASPLPLANRPVVPSSFSAPPSAAAAHKETRAIHSSFPPEPVIPVKSDEKKKEIMSGLLALVSGCILSFLYYGHVSTGGDGRFNFFYGLMVIGFWRTIRGICRNS